MKQLAAGHTSVAANIVLFQVGWFACVLGAAQGHPWIGAVAAAVIVGWHVWRAAQPPQEFNLIVSVIILGTLWDSLLVMLGWISYTSGTLIAGAAPYWIVALWALFATSLNVSLRWLKQRLPWAALLGAISGPLSYWAASRLGAAHFVEPLYIVPALAIGWALIMPALMLLSRWYDGIDVPRGSPA